MRTTADGAEFMRELAGVVREHVGVAFKSISARMDALEARPVYVPKDGVGLEAGELSESGCLILRLSDGRKLDVGRVVGEKGKDAEPVDVAKLAEDVFARVPVPEKGKDGESVTVADLAPLVAEEVGKAISALPKVKDGVGVGGAVIDRGGSLVLTLTDGSTKDLGRIVGKDADLADMERIILREVAKFPAPKDGKDGFGFDDLSVVHDGERGFVFAFKRGDAVKEFPFVVPLVLDRGVWREGKFAKGDGVTLGGSFWIAQCDTEAKPETSKDWRLAVKRGRDGKDGGPGPRGKDGEPGRPGRDLTQLAFDGQRT